MEGNTGGPSIQDCEKFSATTGIPSANLLAKKSLVGLVHISEPADESALGFSTTTTSLNLEISSKAVSINPASVLIAPAAQRVPASREGAAMRSKARADWLHPAQS
jgi:hypothetical protein